MRYGFSPENWAALAEALRHHAADNEIMETEQTPFGTRYIIEGPLSTPDGRNPLVRVVWFVEHNEVIPRLATAYPLKRNGLGYEVEFMTLDGETIAIVSLAASQVRSIAAREIAYARPVEPVSAY